MNLAYIRMILVSGMVSALAAFPVSIGLALIAGVPPSVMVAASIYAGAFSAIFGSRYGVGGPNAAVAVMTGGALLPFAAPESNLYLGYVVTLCFLVGLYQLMFALMLRKVNLLDYISTTVIDGLIYGVGITFVMSSLWMALGLAQPGGFQWSVFHFVMSLDRFLDGSVPRTAAVISGISVLTGVAAMNWKPTKRYAVLAGIIGGSIAALVVGGDMERVGWVTPHLFTVSIPDFRQVTWPILFNMASGPALAIAIVGTLQSLTAAKTIRDPDEPFRPVREATNQGMQNLFMAFFSGAPVANSYNKSTLKQSLGGGWDSHVVATLSTVVLAFALADIAAWLPMSVMGGALILVGMGMMSPARYRKHASHGPVRKWLFLVPAVLSIITDLQTALFSGVILSIVVHIASLSRMELEVSRAGGSIVLKLSGVLFYLSSARLESAVLAKLEEADIEGFHDALRVDLNLTSAHLMSMDSLGLDWLSRIAVPVQVHVTQEQLHKATEMMKKEGLHNKVTMVAVQ
ncbi:MAG: SulP family inorganic anion transporter [Sideroxyarcus sp.]|nr:SulP family inorganic anion transporter [Sideroxyarcus sp.]